MINEQNNRSLKMFIRHYKFVLCGYCLEEAFSVAENDLAKYHRSTIIFSNEKWALDYTLFCGIQERKHLGFFPLLLAVNYISSNIITKEKKRERREETRASQKVHAPELSPSAVNMATRKSGEILGIKPQPQKRKSRWTFITHNILYIYIYVINFSLPCAFNNIWGYRLMIHKTFIRKNHELPFKMGIIITVHC